MFRRVSRKDGIRWWGVHGGAVSRSKPTVDEMELWPNTVWRMAALLRAGLEPRDVFNRLVVEGTEVEPPADPVERVATVSARRALAAAREDLGLVLEHCRLRAGCGQPVSEAMKSLVDRGRLGRRYSEQRLVEMAACWRVSERTGAPLSRVLENLARFYESEIDLSQARDSAMSGPKATARILSWLPLLGLGLGVLMGTDPLGMLFGSVLGLLVGGTGLGLALAGRRWTARLVDLAERGEL